MKTWNGLRAVSLLLCVIALAPQAASAQAVCSAPHSSPTLGQSGSIGEIRQGAGWVQLSVVGSRATESFGPFGGRLGFAGDSEFETRSAYITGSLGVLEGLEIWGQVPIHRLDRGRTRRDKPQQWRRRHPERAAREPGAVRHLRRPNRSPRRSQGFGK